MDFIIIHGSPGCGKTTLASKLHEHFESPYFEFGWIPEYSKLAPSLKISTQLEEKLSFENLVTVAKNYNNYGFKNVILTDFDDVRMLDIHNIFSNFNYAVITLFVDDDEIIKQRILNRTNGNKFKDWELSLRINSLIRKRDKLPNEYRILNTQNDEEIILKKIIDILNNHKPKNSIDTSSASKEDYFSYISD